MHRVPLWCSAAGLFVIAVSVSTAVSAELVSPTQSWQPGDSWDLQVEMYRRTFLAPSSRQAPAGPKKSPTPDARFLINVRVVGVEDFKNSPCWQVDFSPSAQAPAELREACRVLVRQRDGSTCRIVRGQDVLGWLFDTIGPLVVVTGAPLGLPLEWFPFAENGEYKTVESALTLVLQRRVVQDVEVREAFIRRGGQNEVMLQQIWRKGEKFWREYTRFVKGHKDLTARLIRPSSSIPPIRVEEPRVEDRDDPTGLHVDPRLRVKLTISLSKPTVSAILSRVEEATNVALSLEPKLQRDEAAFAAANWTNMPAWSVLLQLAEASRIKGRWSKWGDGYQLFKGPDAVAEEKSVSPMFQAHSLVLAAVAAGQLAVFVVVLVLRKLKRTGQIHQT